MSGWNAVLLAALAGGLAALAVREAVGATPAVARSVARALEPLGRAGREGYAPSALERRRLGTLGSVVLLGAGLLLVGPAAALAAGLAGPLVAAAAISRRRSRYRRAVERALPEMSRAIADSLAAGRSLRGALLLATRSLDGPAGVEMARLAADLDVGTPTHASIEALRARLASTRVEGFCAVLLSQRLAGGDLAGLLRRFAAGAADRERAGEDARAATAQARFTGLLVVAMPTGAALFAELLSPGFAGSLLADPVAASLLALAALLQAAGFVAIRRLAQVAW